MQSHSKSKVCYYYDSDIGNYYYGQGHPMKPHRYTFISDTRGNIAHSWRHRMRMTHNLLLNYGLYRKMEVYRPHKATQDEMTKLHCFMGFQRKYLNPHFKKETLEAIDSEKLTVKRCIKGDGDDPKTKQKICFAPSTFQRDTLYVCIFKLSHLNSKMQL